MKLKCEKTPVHRRQGKTRVPEGSRAPFDPLFLKRMEREAKRQSQFREYMARPLPVQHPRKAREKAPAFTRKLWFIQLHAAVNHANT